MKVILVRHGESIANSKGIHQGQRVDTSLSEKGKEQAIKAAQALKNEKIEAIYSSDLKRAMETAQEIAKLHNLKVIPDKRLREFDSGDFTHLKDRWDRFVKLKDSESKRLGIESYEVKIPGGESELDHFHRVRDFFREIKNHKGNIVLVGHGGTNKLFFGAAESVPREEMYSVPQDNSAISVVELTKKGNKIIKVNDIKHLN